MSSVKAVYAVQSYRKFSTPRLLTIVATVVAVCWMTQGSAEAVVINFDNLASGAVVAFQYPEATFSSDSGFENRTLAGNYGTSLPNFICTAVTGGAYTCVNTTIVNFTSPAANLTFYALGDDNAGVTAKVDVYVNNVYSATVDVVTDGSLGTAHLVDLSAYTNVTRIVIHTITDGNGLGWDDFVFDDVVPVNATTWGRIKSLYR